MNCSYNWVILSPVIMPQAESHLSVQSLTKQTSQCVVDESPPLWLCCNENLFGSFFFSCDLKGSFLSLKGSL